MHVCLFDIDGTLVNTGGAGSVAMGLAMATAFGMPDGSDGVAFAGRTDRAILGDLFELRGIEQTAANLERFRSAFLLHLSEHLPRKKGHVLPGVTELLDTLAPRSDVALGLLTGNMREGARHKLEHFGLFHHFAFGGYGDDHLDRSDVARLALAEAERHLGGDCPGERTWVIGDTEQDVHCARAIGARVVAVATGPYLAEELAATRPDLLLDSLAESSRLLALLDS